MHKLFYLLVFFCLWITSYSQIDTITVQDSITYRFIKTDGGELIGKILSQDAREILIITKENREVYIPQHAIKEMIPVKTSDFNSKGDFIGEDKFSTRYFINTNGLPIKKGDHYVQWNLFGPDFQFGLGNNFGVGVMTSWLGIPIVGTIKQSWELGAKTQFAIGGLFGTGSWGSFNSGGILPFATLSFGDRSKNLAISGGYGAVWIDGDGGGRALMSISGMTKVSPKISLVFDSFILLPGKTETITNPYNEYENEKPGLMLLIPGVRWHQAEGQAFQFGFTAFTYDGIFLPIPIPMVQWYRSL